MKKLKEFTTFGLKLILFIVGFVACLLCTTLILFVLTQMSFSNCIATAAFPSLFTGIWCSMAKEKDLKIE